MEKTENFLLTKHKKELVKPALTILFFGGLLIASVVKTEGSIKYFYYALFSCLTILGAMEFTLILRWRVIVSDNEISIRKYWIKEVTYKLSDITMVRQRQEIITIVVGEKEVLKVTPEIKNYNVFVERLKDKQVRNENLVLKN